MNLRCRQHSVAGLVAVVLMCGTLSGCGSGSGPVKLTPVPPQSAEEIKVMEDLEKEMRAEAAASNN